MKRIFLTSGLVLCMACPAFANLDANGNVVGTDPAEAASCSYPTLLGTTGSSTFTAQWTSITHTVTLDASSATTYGGPATTNVTPTVLYSEYGQNKHMYTTMTGEGDTAQFTGEITPLSTDVISIDPVGKSVTLTVDTGMGYVNTNYNAGSAYTVAQTTTDLNRPFNGFWASTSTEGNNELYINTSGQVTDAGHAAAIGSNAAQTWYAHYNCATFTQPAAPSLTGYEFGGWYEDSSLQTAVTNWCKDDNDTIYAKWTPTTGYSITYNCGNTTDANSPVPEAQTGITYDEMVTLRANTCTYAGRTFAGWNCNYNIGYGTEHSENEANFVGASGNGAASVVFRTVSNVTCTAMWEENTIGLTWMADTGSGVQNITTAGTNNECTYAGDIPMPQNPTRPGYEFTGWAVVNTPANN